MSKFVNWGHWFVAAFFIVVGVRMLWPTLAGLPKLAPLLHHYPRYMTYIVIEEALTWVVALICGWGILGWRPWARVLGIVLSAYVLAISVTASIYFHPGPRGSWPLGALTLISCCVFIWLFLPAVRAEYLRRTRIA